MKAIAAVDAVPQSRAGQRLRDGLRIGQQRRAGDDVGRHESVRQVLFRVRERVEKERQRERRSVRRFAAERVAGLQDLWVLGQFVVHVEHGSPFRVAQFAIEERAEIFD